ncbi:huntingtin-interacting protein M-like [Choloepus didactylus]|uniref:huntingtin-interacting protein M-like n=1 Tax=Choloepus didactylus TaxID=27675 RepID=UPI00189EC9BF|nr:huntingtin-interacting protein M-like [Choloepus didactylus]
MPGKKCHIHRKLIPSLAARRELQFPVNCLKCLLKEGEYAQCLSSNTPDFLLDILDFLTTYVLELAASEAYSEHGTSITPLDVERRVHSSHKLGCLLKNVTSRQFDEMCQSRKTG